MTRKRSRRKVIVPLPPRGLRPKLDQNQLLDLSLAHYANLDAIATGKADVDVLWQTVGGALTWCRVAELLHIGEAEMTQQLQLLERVVERYGRTQRVLFTGEEYQLAKVGCEVMDQLAAMVDRPTAIAAAEWSENKVNQLEAACRERQRAAA